MAYLTGPTRTLADWQVEYDGLLLGTGTPYDLPPTWTFLDSPPVKTMDTAKPWADGSWSGPDFADVATWQLPVEIAPDGGTAFGDALIALITTFVISKQSRPLWVKLPGFAVRGIGARVAQRSLPIDLGFGQLVAGAVQWRAPRPVWQSMPRTVVLSPFTNGGALSSPMFSPDGILDFAITSPALYSTVLANAGNTDAPPVAVVTGPTDGFQLAVGGSVVAYAGPIAVTDAVTVDWATGRAYLSTGGSAPVDRTAQLTARDFSGNVPARGTAAVTFTARGGTASITTADLWR